MPHTHRSQSPSIVSNSDANDDNNNNNNIKNRNGNAAGVGTGELPPLQASCCPSIPYHLRNGHGVNVVGLNLASHLIRSSFSYQTNRNSNNNNNNNTNSAVTASAEKKSSTKRSASVGTTDAAITTLSGSGTNGSNNHHQQHHHLPPHPPLAKQNNKKISVSNQDNNHVGVNIIVPGASASATGAATTTPAVVASTSCGISSGAASSIILRRVPLCMHSRCWFADTVNERGHTLRRRVEDHIRRTRSVSHNSFAIIFTKLWMRIMERYPSLIEPHGAAVTDVLLVGTAAAAVPHRPAAAPAAASAAPRRGLAAVNSSSSNSISNNNNEFPAFPPSAPHRRLIDQALINQALRAQFAGFVDADTYFRCWPHEECVANPTTTISITTAAAAVAAATAIGGGAGAVSASHNNRNSNNRSMIPVSNDGSNLGGCSNDSNTAAPPVRNRNITTLGALLRPSPMSWSISNATPSKNNTTNYRHELGAAAAHSSRLVDPPVRFDLFLCSMMHASGDDGEPYGFLFALYLLHLLGTIQAIDHNTATGNNNNNMTQQQQQQLCDTARQENTNKEAVSSSSSSSSSNTRDVSPLREDHNSPAASAAVAVNKGQDDDSRRFHCEHDGADVRSSQGADDDAAAAAMTTTKSELPSSGENKKNNNNTDKNNNNNKMSPMFPGINVGQQLRLATTLICLGHKFVGDAEYSMGYFLKCLPPLFANSEEACSSSSRNSKNMPSASTSTSTTTTTTTAAMNDCSCVVWDRHEMIRLEEHVLVKLEMFGRVPSVVSKRQMVELLTGEYGASPTEHEVLTNLLEIGA